MARVPSPLKACADQAAPAVARETLVPPAHGAQHDSSRPLSTVDTRRTIPRSVGQLSPPARSCPAAAGTVFLVTTLAPARSWIALAALASPAPVPRHVSPMWDR